MYPYPELKALLLGLILIDTRKSILNLGRAAHSIDCARELGQHAITSRVRYSPTMLSNQPVYDLAMLGQAPERPILILAHQARVTRHISREDGCQPSLDSVLLPIHQTLGAALGEILRWAGSGVQPGSGTCKIRLPSLAVS
jgi:hypothetical protein